MILVLGDPRGNLGVERLVLGMIMSDINFRKFDP
jgi:hypothetical protein